MRWYPLPFATCAGQQWFYVSQIRDETAAVLMCHGDVNVGAHINTTASPQTHTRCAPNRTQLQHDFRPFCQSIFNHLFGWFFDPATNAHTPW